MRDQVAPKGARGPPTAFVSSLCRKKHGISGGEESSIGTEPGKRARETTNRTSLKSPPVSATGLFDWRRRRRMMVLSAGL